MLKITKKTKTIPVYDITVDDTHNFYANGMLVHNCVEVIQCTKPIQNINDPDGEIGICLLAAINSLEQNSDNDIKNTCKIAVNGLESVIDYQDYPVKAGENFAKNRRSLGVGITNLAAFMAKHKIDYNDPGKEGLQIIHDFMEKVQWYLLDASCELAKEKGPCKKFGDTKYAQGLLPIDWYKKTVDELVPPKYNMDWEDLRARIKKYGLRHSTLSAIMPCESSSVIQNSTNGVEPVRDLLAYKKAKNGSLKQLVPNFHSRKNFYTKAWDIRTNTGIIQINAVLQKYVDMGISTNAYYNYDHYDNQQVPLSVIVQDQITAYKYGLKNLYYANTPDGDGEEDSGCASGACSI